MARILIEIDSCLPKQQKIKHEIGHVVNYVNDYPPILHSGMCDGQINVILNWPVHAYGADNMLSTMTITTRFLPELPTHDRLQSIQGESQSIQKSRFLRLLNRMMPKNRKTIH